MTSRTSRASFHVFPIAAAFDGVMPASMSRAGWASMHVRLITRDQQDALVVPEQAIVPQGDEKFVFRIVDGKAVRTRVTVGQRRDGKAEIASGLAAGDTVVSAGQLKLRDGVAVAVAGNGARAVAGGEATEAAQPPGTSAPAVPAPKS